MLYWNQKRHYRLLSSQDRELYVMEMSPVYFRKWMKRINLLLNIAVPLILYLGFKLPLIQLAYAFIAFDIILHLFEQIVFITIPWAIAKIPAVLIAQWQYNGIKQNLSRIDDRIDFLRKKHCRSCNDGGYDWEHCRRCKLIKELCYKRSAVAESLTAAEKRLEELKAKRDGVSTTKPKAVAVTVVEQPIKKDTSLVTYFQTISTECNKLISTHRFDFLIAIRKSTDSLASILKNKPEGETEIAGTLCYRLDNLVKLLTNLSTETDEVRNAYFEDAKAAANALNNELQLTISVINKMVPGVDMNTPAMLLAKTTLTKETQHV